MDASGVSSAPLMVGSETELRAVQAMLPVAASPIAPVAVSMAQVQVAVPTGAEPGQQIMFLPPGHEQTMSVEVPQHLEPGAVFTVQYPVAPSAAATAAVGDVRSAAAEAAQARAYAAMAQRGTMDDWRRQQRCESSGGDPQSSTPQSSQPQALRPALAPQAEEIEIELGDAAPVQVDLERDNRWAVNLWTLYATGWLFGCFVSPFLALCLWISGCGFFFCKRSEDRSLLPRSRRVARTIAATVGVFSVLLLLLVVLVAAHHGHAWHHWHHGHGHHHHGHHHYHHDD